MSRNLPWLALVAGLLSCRGRGSPNYQETVAPLLARRCLGCHGAAGAPPPLGTYEEAARVADLIRLTVLRREMPPWGADNTGLCGSFRDAAWLEPAEIEMLAAWAQHGAPRGDPARGLQPAAPAPPFGPVQVTVVQPVAFSPGLGQDSYRCFLVDPQLDRDVLITGLRFADGGRVPIRQATLHALDGDAALQAARALDARDAAPGWPCFGGSGVPGSRLVASWSWNSPVQRLPQGTGVRLASGRLLVLQLRYNLFVAGLSSTVRARLELEARTPAVEAELLPLHAGGFVLPPGNPRAEVSADLPINRRLTLAGVVPDMHALGREWKLSLRRGDSEICLGYFSHWDLYDQQLFQYERPVSLEPGDRLKLTCAYSTTSRQEVVKEGEAIDEEACDAELYVLPGG